MTNGIGTIEIKKQRGTMVVNGLGATPRGQRFISKQIPINAKSPADPNFKAEVATAIKEMLG